MKLKALALALAIGVGAGALVACDGSKEHVNESYQGVPKNGQSCKEFYKLPANQVKCTQAEGRH